MQFVPKNRQSFNFNLQKVPNDIRCLQSLEFSMAGHEMSAQFFVSILFERKRHQLDSFMIHLKTSNLNTTFFGTTVQSFCIYIVSFADNER